MNLKSNSSPRRLEIRRYANRRFYDTTRSKHVTLEEIHQLIQKGYDVTITDANTNEDITARILTQLIVDLDSSKLYVFPAELLHRIIRSNEALVRDFIDKYFTQALMLFLESRRKFEDQMRQMMGFTPETNPSMDWMKLMWSQFPPTFWPGPPRKSNSVPETPKEEAETENDLHQVIHDLREQMETMRREVTRLKSKPKSSRRKK